MTLTETVNGLLAWSAPRMVTNSRGQRILRTAAPTGEFWGLWRTCKTSLQDLGITAQLSAGAWTVCWYQDPAPVAAAPAPVVAAAPGGRTWSSEQQAIFAWFGKGSGSLIVRARAGTGKTTTIKTAFTYAKEDRMLYAVFNKKNQVEATSAIDDPRVEVRTLHSLGFMFIQQVWPACKPTDDVEFDRVEAVVGADAPMQVKRQVLKLVGFLKNTMVSPTVSEAIEIAFERDIETPSFSDEESGGWTVEKLAASAVMVLAASKQKDKANRISFNDMVWLPVAMNWVRAWFDLVVVDEAQDMNLPQLLMAKGSAKPGGRVVVVGDDRQAIYGFRGAVSDGMDMMKKTLRASELGLTTTYRCPKAVVALAAQLVPDYKAAATAPEGTVQEINVQAITSFVAVGDAILSRSSAALMPICLALLRKGTPARIEGKDLGRALTEIMDRLNARTVPQFLQKVAAWGEKQINRLNPSRSNFEEKSGQILDNVEALTALAEGASGVTEIRSRIGNMFSDTGPNARPAVVLSTTHKAKGLEWSKVFLLDSTFNRKRPVNAAPVSPEADLARATEEANIYYVALTRAKAHLVLAEGDWKR